MGQSHSQNVGGAGSNLPPEILGNIGQFSDNETRRNMRQSGKDMFAVPHPDFVSHLRASKETDIQDPDVYENYRGLFSDFVLNATPRDKAPFVQFLQDVKAGRFPAHNPDELRAAFLDWVQMNDHWVFKQSQDRGRVVWMLQAFENAGYGVLDVINDEIVSAHSQAFSTRLQTIRKNAFGIDYDEVETDEDAEYDDY